MQHFGKLKTGSSALPPGTYGPKCPVRLTLLGYPILRMASDIAPFLTACVNMSIIFASEGDLLDVDLMCSNCALDPQLIRSEVLHVATASAQDHLRQSLQQSPGRRRSSARCCKTKQMFGAICCAARLCVSGPVTVRHHFHISQILVVLKMQFGHLCAYRITLFDSCSPLSSFTRVLRSNTGHT